MLVQPGWLSVNSRTASFSFCQLKCSGNCYQEDCISKKPGMKQEADSLTPETMKKCFSLCGRCGPEREKPGMMELTAPVNDWLGARSGHGKADVWSRLTDAERRWLAVGVAEQK